MPNSNQKKRKIHCLLKFITNNISILQIIYVTRNPRDACVSYHNHWKILEGYHGGFEAFAESFISDIAGYYSPFIHHVLGKY